jgi:hypothetical protein
MQISRRIDGLQVMSDTVHRKSIDATRQYINERLGVGAGMQEIKGK